MPCFGFQHEKFQVPPVVRNNAVLFFMYYSSYSKNFQKYTTLLIHEDKGRCLIVSEMLLIVNCDTDFTNLQRTIT